jgi:ribosomal protein L29
MSKEIKELIGKDIVNLSLSDMYKALHETKGALMELNLSSAREYLANYKSKKNKFKKTICRLMYFIKTQEQKEYVKDIFEKFGGLEAFVKDAKKAQEQEATIEISK